MSNAGSAEAVINHAAYGQYVFEVAVSNGSEEVSVIVDKETAQVSRDSIGGGSFPALAVLVLAILAGRHQRLRR